MHTADLVELAKIKFDHALHRVTLREKIETQLCITHNGGMFKATKELICFVSLWDPTNPTLFLEDLYGNPIKCNREELKKQLEEAYQYAMNAWWVEFEEMKRVRKISDA